MILSERFERALVYADQLHRHQKRKSGQTPYVAHLLSVTSIVLENNGNEDEAIAALLHDAVEDQGGQSTLLYIQEHFGETVAEIVQGCSDSTGSPKPPWQKRKQAYLDHLLVANASVRLVSAADTLHNMRTLVKDYRQLGETVWTNFKGGREGTLWWYRALTSIHKSFGQNWLAEELQRTLDILEQII